MIDRTSHLAVSDLIAEMERRHAELDRKRADRQQAASARSAQIAASYSLERGEREFKLAGMLARVAASAALCEQRVSRVAS